MANKFPKLPYASSAQLAELLEGLHQEATRLEQELARAVADMRRRRPRWAFHGLTRAWRAQQKVSSVLSGVLAMTASIRLLGRLLRWGLGRPAASEHRSAELAGPTAGPGDTA